MLFLSLLMQALVTKYGKDSDKVIAAAEGVRSVVDKVRVGEGVREWWRK